MQHVPFLEPADAQVLEQDVQLYQMDAADNLMYDQPLLPQPDMFQANSTPIQQMDSNHNLVCIQESREGFAQLPPQQQQQKLPTFSQNPQQFGPAHLADAHQQPFEFRYPNFQEPAADARDQEQQLLLDQKPRSAKPFKLLFEDIKENEEDNLKGSNESKSQEAGEGADISSLKGSRSNKYKDILNKINLNQAEKNSYYQDLIKQHQISSVQSESECPKGNLDQIKSLPADCGAA